MRPEIVPATIRDVTWIAANLREQDRDEIGEVYPGSLTALAIGLVLGSAAAWVARIGADPVGALGIVDIHPGIGSGWAFGTNRFRRVVPELTRFCIGEVAPWLVGNGYRRVEVRTAVDHDLSHRWLCGMGFQREALCRRFGRTKDFWLYAATGTN